MYLFILTLYYTLIRSQIFAPFSDSISQILVWLFNSSVSFIKKKKKLFSFIKDFAYPHIFGSVINSGVTL